MKGGFYELALFAGAGGGQLGGKLLGWRTVCYVERQSYAVEVLKARIRDGWLDDAPIWDDARTFDGRPWSGLVDIVSAGFPCQPWSAAGKQRGERDERNLWPDTLRIIREVKPEWVLLENVARLLSYAYVRRIFGDLAESGYDAEWDCIPACAVGAPHIRDRVWIVAHTNADKQQYEGCSQAERGTATAELSADSEYDQVLFNEQRYGESNADVDGNDWWSIEPGLGRVAHGVARRVDRLTAIGNGQVPAVVRFAWDHLARRLI